MNNKVYVWDPLIRFFHWSLVLAFVIAYFTGDEENILHIYSSYYIMGLIAVRILWGFVGTKYARFHDFIYPPRAVLNYLKGLFSSDKGKNYLGHNPAGGWMVVALLISLLATSISGLKVYGLEGYGPLAVNNASIYPVQNPGGLVKVSSYEKEHHEDEDEEENEGEDEAEEFWEELHEFFANFTVFLVFLHIGGVITSSLKHGQNLVKSMITGYKRQ